MIKLTKKQIIESAQALFQIGELNCSEKAAHILARNYLKLKTITEEIDKERVKIWKENFGEKGQVNNDDPNLFKYNEQYNSGVLNQETYFDPEYIELKDLNLDKNGIRPVILSSISWMISDFDKKV